MIQHLSHTELNPQNIFNFPEKRKNSNNIYVIIKMKKQLIQLTQYNYWANKQLIKLLEKIPAEYNDTEIKSSFGTLKKTVYHIWDAEFIWLERLKGNNIKNWPSKQYKFEASIKQMLETSKSLIDWAKNYDEILLSSKIVYRDQKNRKKSSTNLNVFFHTVNHSTFHRGQAVGIIRSLGYSGKIKATDMMTFFKSN
jgi:uncharacterized damage-inducible protein DinB